MYVILEYLTYLALVSFFGLILFGTAVLGLVVKTGATKLAEQAAAKVPQIASRLSSQETANFKKDHPNQQAPA